MSTSTSEAWTSNCTAPSPPEWVQDTANAPVAVCITGLLRSLLSEPVTGSFEVMVRRPLLAHGHAVDPFIVLSEQRPTNESLRARIAAAYSPVTLHLTDERPRLPRCRLASMMGHDGSGASAGVLQHFGVDTCFGLVAEHEQRRGSDYGWVLRMRTDMILFAPIWLPKSTQSVYVPGGGMSFRGWTRCSNDHLFLCPRGLCGPYATLIRNFDDPTCAPLPGFAAGGDGVVNGTLRPPPVRLGFQFHIPKAYNATGQNYCGRVVELGLVYAIARSRPDGMSGGLACENNLKFMWPSHARGLVHSRLRDCALGECARVSRRFNGGTLLNTTEMFAFERTIVRHEERLGHHRPAPKVVGRR